ncbi:MAG: hypothetical protein II592_09080, partial [Muribaculaceae bacterium]|nr:hypothetical protein [Muribaculaceae bacterium]
MVIKRLINVYRKITYKYEKNGTFSKKKYATPALFHLFQVVFLHHLTTVQNGSTSVRRGLKLS